MRETREELLTRFPSWNESRHDIVAVMYGDIPLYRYDKRQFVEYENADGTLANILAVDAYIWTVNGDFDLYRTLQGDVRIKTDGTILCGDANIHYGGQTYEIDLNEMYSWHKLKIGRIHTQGCGGWYAWSTGPGFKHYKDSSLWRKQDHELDNETIEKVFDSKEWDDFGEPIRKFRDRCRELYESDPENHFMEEYE